MATHIYMYVYVRSLLETLRVSCLIKVVPVTTGHHLDATGVYHSQWLNHVRVTLQHCGFSEIWINPFKQENMNGLHNKVKRVLMDQHIQSWRSEVEQQSKCLNYKMYNTNYDQLWY
jgi:hypothetical protein